MPAPDDVSLTGGSPESTGVSQDVLDNIESVLSGADGAELDLVGEATEPVKPAAVTPPTPPSPREVARREQVKREQAEELDESGQTGPNNPEGHAAPEAVETDTTETEDEPEGEEQTETPASSAIPSLDPNLRFVAQQFGWTDEKIDKLNKADPELAADTFTQLASAYTNLSRQYVVPQGQPPAAPQPVAQPQAPASKLDQLYADLSSFAEENGDTIVERLLKPLRDEVIEPVRRMQAALEVQQQAAVRAEVQSTLSALTGQFGDVYGKDDATLTPQQQQSRVNLAGIADQIRAGAKMQGRELSVKEALNRAHLIVTADRRDEAVRTQVRDQVQKRNRQITARPTARQAPKAALGKRSDNAAMEAFERRASELGIEV